MSAGHHLILGGARSGKTSLGEKLALHYGVRPAYLATAEALDHEMRERVATHQRTRASHFVTIEEPLDLAGAIRMAAPRHDVILVDCLTLWISNLLGRNIGVAGAVEALAETLIGLADTRVIMVSNEVGLGIVPDNALARTFRDLTGATHQRLAEICDTVLFVAAGLPLAMKGHLPDWEQ